MFLVGSIFEAINSVLGRCLVDREPQYTSHSLKHDQPSARNPTTDRYGPLGHSYRAH